MLPPIRLPTMLPRRKRAAGESKKDQKKDGDLPFEEAVVDRLIEVVKNAQASGDQRWNSCLALATRGAKAKRAVPEMAKYLDELLNKDVVVGVYTQPTKENGFKGGYISLYGGKVTQLAEAFGNIGPDAKEAVPVLSKIITKVPNHNDKGKEQPSWAAYYAAAESLGKIGSQDSFDALKRAANKEANPEVRKAAVKGLGIIAGNSKSDVKTAVVVELAGMAVTDASPQVRELVVKGLGDIAGNSSSDVKAAVLVQLQVIAETETDTQCKGRQAKSSNRSTAKTRRR